MSNSKYTPPVLTIPTHYKNGEPRPQTDDTRANELKMKLKAQRELMKSGGQYYRHNQYVYRVYPQRCYLGLAVFHVRADGGGWAVRKKHDGIMRPGEVQPVPPTYVRTLDDEFWINQDKSKDDVISLLLDEDTAICADPFRRTPLITADLVRNIKHEFLKNRIPLRFPYPHYEPFVEYAHLATQGLQYSDRSLPPVEGEVYTSKTLPRLPARVARKLEREKAERTAAQLGQDAKPENGEVKPENEARRRIRNIRPSIEVSPSPSAPEPAVKVENAPVVPTETGIVVLAHVSRKKLTGLHCISVSHLHQELFSIRDSTPQRDEDTMLIEKVVEFDGGRCKLTKEGRKLGKYNLEVEPKWNYGFLGRFQSKEVTNHRGNLRLHEIRMDGRSCRAIATRMRDYYPLIHDLLSPLFGMVSGGARWCVIGYTPYALTPEISTSIRPLKSYHEGIWSDDCKYTPEVAHGLRVRLREVICREIISLYCSNCRVIRDKYFYITKNRYLVSLYPESNNLDKDRNTNFDIQIDECFHNKYLGNDVEMGQYLRTTASLIIEQHGGRDNFVESVRSALENGKPWSSTKDEIIERFDHILNSGKPGAKPLRISKMGRGTPIPPTPAKTKEVGKRPRAPPKRNEVYNIPDTPATTTDAPAETKPKSENGKNKNKPTISPANVKVVVPPEPFQLIHCVDNNGQHYIELIHKSNNTTRIDLSNIPSTNTYNIRLEKDSCLVENYTSIPAPIPATEATSAPENEHVEEDECEEETEATSAPENEDESEFEDGEESEEGTVENEEVQEPKEPEEPEEPKERKETMNKRIFSLFDILFDEDGETTENITRIYAHSEEEETASDGDENGEYQTIEVDGTNEYVIETREIRENEGLSKAGYVYDHGKKLTFISLHIVRLENTYNPISEVPPPALQINRCGKYPPVTTHRVSREKYRHDRLMLKKHYIDGGKRWNRKLFPSALSQVEIAVPEYVPPVEPPRPVVLPKFKTIHVKDERVNQPLISYKGSEHVGTYVMDYNNRSTAYYTRGVGDESQNPTFRSHIYLTTDEFEYNDDDFMTYKRSSYGSGKGTSGVTYLLEPECQQIPNSAIILDIPLHFLSYGLCDPERLDGISRAIMSISGAPHIPVYVFPLQYLLSRKPQLRGKRIIITIDPRIHDREEDHFKIMGEEELKGELICE